ncbi:unnamed protein product, partial [Prorocentrum cordatum]
PSSPTQAGAPSQASSASVHGASSEQSTGEEPPGPPDAVGAAPPGSDTQEPRAPGGLQAMEALKAENEQLKLELEQARAELKTLKADGGEPELSTSKSPGADLDEAVCKPLDKLQADRLVETKALEESAIKELAFQAKLKDSLWQVEQRSREECQDHERQLEQKLQDYRESWASEVRPLHDEVLRLQSGALQAEENAARARARAGAAARGPEAPASPERFVGGASAMTPSAAARPAMWSGSPASAGAPASSGPLAVNFQAPVAVQLEPVRPAEAPRPVPPTGAPGSPPRSASPPRASRLLLAPSLGSPSSSRAAAARPFSPSHPGGPGGPLQQRFGPGSPGRPLAGGSPARALPPAAAPAEPLAGTRAALQPAVAAATAWAPAQLGGGSPVAPTAPSRAAAGLRAPQQARGRLSMLEDEVRQFAQQLGIGISDRSSASPQRVAPRPTDSPAQRAGRSAWS